MFHRYVNWILGDGRWIKSNQIKLESNMTIHKLFYILHAYNQSASWSLYLNYVIWKLHCCFCETDIFNFILLIFGVVTPCRLVHNWRQYVSPKQNLSTGLHGMLYKRPTLTSSQLWEPHMSLVLLFYQVLEIAFHRCNGQKWRSCVNGKPT